MIFPSKITSIEDSVLSKLLPVIKLLKEQPLTVTDLRKKTQKYIKNTSELIQVLDCLYALNKISITKENKLYYVEND